MRGGPATLRTSSWRPVTGKDCAQVLGNVLKAELSHFELLLDLLDPKEACQLLDCKRMEESREQMGREHVQERCGFALRRPEVQPAKI